MILKKLDIAGFKSFAGKVSIDFMPGVTAVVGPNGSGKSNITEAIRWVLGEQSAKNLRGGKMEDVIFSGSDSRRRLNEADVTITLDNRDGALPLDYSEVSITRRVNRNGDSGFFINKQSCRLKDIIELFMDSGLGRGAFSIIGQGRVDEILNSRPEERRSIFEEAAGVLKYKTRKKQAEVKLAETEENLSRVQDILYELEQRVEPLEIQAAAAKDYLEKKEELKEVEASVWAYDLGESHAEWEERKKDREHQEKQIAYFSREAESAESHIRAVEQELKKLAVEEEVIQEKLMAVVESLEKIEGTRRLMDERQKNASYNEEKLVKSINEAKEKEAVLKQALAEAKKQSEEKKQALDVLTKQAVEKEALLRAASQNSSETLESLKADYIDHLSKEAAAKNELAEIGRQLERLTARFERLGGHNDQYLSERAALQREQEQIEQARLEAEEKLNEHTTAYREAKRERDSVKEKLERKRNALYKAYQILQEASSRRDLLTSMEEDYSGFFSGVKEVLKEKGGRLPGVIGAAAQLIRVPKQYELAIETALGGALQHIIVEDEAAARKAIAFLKQHKFGRATFLPLSTVKEKVIPDHTLALVRHENGFLGTAAELTDYEERYAQAARHLLGNVLVADSLEKANHIARKINHRYRVVTIEGDVVNAGGSMTGGSVKKTGASLLGRKNELDTLSSQIVQMEQKTAQAEREVKALQDRAAECDRLVSRLEETGELYRQGLQEAKNQQLEWSFNEQSINDRLAVYDAEKREFQEERERLQKREKEASRSLAEKQQAIKQLDDQIAFIEREQKDVTSKRDELTEELYTLRPQIAVLEEQLAFSRQQEQRIGAEWKEIQKQVKQLEEEQAFMKAERSNSGSTGLTLAQEAEEQAAEKERLIKGLELLKKERSSKTQRLEEQTAALQESRRLLKGLTESVRGHDVAIARLEVEIDTWLQKLNEQYSLTFEEAQRLYPLTLPIEESRRQVRLIKRAIEELGDVNLGAIEEYEITFERVTFLRGQKEDLEEAKSTLRDVMNEMDVEMTRRFSETFEAIKAEFQPAFVQLFGGGRAELKLTDPKDILNAGVDISAMPPGKKLQHLSLLSGGERALTAIALLFAILRVRPVPFCILDEVEAALDEANVHRFSRYLKEFSANTQFIVITHRKQTMEEADALYGVAMQESGVTSLVSVRLEEAAVTQ
ncbi:chromosome segregation protein SMC [Domibacillus sp. DTU_2020_1001157_1_SI_ALB_TIR_016]|uniref:chromosome segregation protein SMC n=1 Tax=Domibacillus sp. DTU_2020_1001157_1_SI_ALB_TIR_016 TaxID=3077789 RepID=UPI0028EA8346|nr:chromosome segregation protein SMC [Domibacillus sp. DTU_2020_1001157_1_SI_ALB_TIR_016]WNS79753.1 chromosome segregation protein SMC [Domibacillus sp. DTU_2020_1001157_1_SI_ALB_TIR_016]